MVPWIRDPAIVSSHLADESGLTGTADAALLPTAVDDLRTAVADAAAARLPIAIQGAKTGFCAGAVPDGGVIVNLSRLSAVTAFRYDPATGRGTVTVQAGCTLDHLQAGLKRKNLDPTGWDSASRACWDAYARSADSIWFLPNPTEGAASLGGMVAAGASGSRVPAGGLTAHVAAATVVTADGSLAVLGRGDGLDRLCGSEGTVGVIADLTLDLARKPESVYGLMTFHESHAQAAAFLRALEQAAAAPNVALLAADWFDRACRDLLARDPDALPPQTHHLPTFPDGAASALWLEFAGAEDGLFALLDAAMHGLEQGGGFADAALAATDERDLERIGRFRHLVTESCNRLAAGGPSPVLDWVAPPDAWATVADEASAWRRDAGRPFALMGHARDGRTSARLPGVPFDGDEARRFTRAAADRLRQAGCAASGEHGYGRLKRQWFRDLNPEAWERWRQSRAAADPLGVLNPGVMT